MLIRVAPVGYRYRYCERCRREWPAKHTHCPECVLWLGERPLVRVEWQLVPAESVVVKPSGYECGAALALVLRVLGSRPDEHLLGRAGSLLRSVFGRVSSPRIVGVRNRGWLIWMSADARRAFMDGMEIRDALIDALPAIETSFGQGSRLRWGMIVDSYMLSCCERDGTPVVSPVSAHAIFDFEPDNLLLVSSAIYQANRHWEHFAGVPARRQGDGDYVAYSPLDRKRPSALDHACVADHSAFVDRTDEIARLDQHLKIGRASGRLVAVIAPPGAGKTRLVRHWLQCHTDLNILRACFSIFGGDLIDFVGQLVELPEEIAAVDALVKAVLDRIDRDRVDVLMLDDLHWADELSWAFLHELLAGIRLYRVIVILCTRPAAQARIATFTPDLTLSLNPLPMADIEELARRLTSSPAVAAGAIRLARGNPLFVEQFTAWAAEAGYDGNGPHPETLHDVILARIRHMEGTRVRGLRERLGWSAPWMRADVDREFAAIESEIGLWLDRLETGDYGDQPRMADYLALLQRVDFELFMAANLSGRPRPRSARLREAIERLMLGSADALLSDMRRQAAALTRRDDLHLADRAEWMGDCAAENHRWGIARECLELAHQIAPAWRRNRLRERLAGIRRLTGIVSDDGALGGETDIVRELEEHPAVMDARLPETWYRLGQRFRRRLYYDRAVGPRTPSGPPNGPLEFERLWQSPQRRSCGQRCHEAVSRPRLLFRRCSFTMFASAVEFAGIALVGQ